MLKTRIRTLYCELLGETIKQQLLEQEIHQNDISYYFDDDAILISAPAISQILKGKRNITLDTAEAFQDTLGLPDLKSVFFPSIPFCKSLIIQITNLILTDKYSSTKLLFQEKETAIYKNVSFLANNLYNYFPDFPEEDSTYQVAESLTEWLIEFVALVAQL